MLLLFALCLTWSLESRAGDAALRAHRLELWTELTRPETIWLQPAQPIIPVEGVSSADLRDSFDAPRADGRRHEAIDIMARRDTPVVAAVDGEIRRMKTSTAGGLTIYQFDESERRVYYYAHLARYRAGLHEHDFVRRGEIIGYVGSSGNATPGAPHLHFAVADLPPSKEWWKGSPLNPYRLLLEKLTTNEEVVHAAAATTRMSTE